jgi:peptidoglycan/LPS O-acetylase OafA/YrhL
MEREPTHLAFLDGLRGLTALFILLHHAAREVPWESMSDWLAGATGWLDYGHSAVAVFIVLSGFSLMMPVVKTGQVRGGFAGYIARRARRILPAYYAALAFSLLLIWYCPILSQTDDPRWEHALPAFSFRSAILPHLLLVHNLKGWWAMRIDPPMWSVATEWQIYFLFPILIFAWRRWGVTTMITLGFAAGIVVGLSNHFESTKVMSPWYTGLFAMGMAAAVAVFGDKDRRPMWADRSPWFLLMAVVAAMSLSPGIALQDALVGAATAALLVFCARSAGADPDDEFRPAILRLMESRPLAVVGGFSYSLYLVHYPLLVLATGHLKQWGYGPDTRVFILLLVVSPLVIAASYAFHCLFERPFMARKARSQPGAGKVAELVPAS